MRTWETFLADVLPDVPGCPEPQAERALLHAARKFCRETLIWRTDLQRILTQEGVSTYTIAYPDQADAVRFVGATLGGHELELAVIDGVSATERLYGNAGPARILTRDLRKVQFMPGNPPPGKDLIIEAVLMPSDSSRGIPEEIGSQHAQTLTRGALELLLKANKAPWANPGLAMEYGRLFTEDIDDVRLAVWKAHTNRRPRSRAQFM